MDGLYWSSNGVADGSPPMSHRSRSSAIASNHYGAIYQKDLGAGTGQVAAKMTLPDNDY
jgi:hypothetical protein